MKLLFDLFPVVVFFVVYKLHEDNHEGILAATAAIILATAVQVAISWWRHQRVERMHLITLGLVVVFGGATLWLDDELFIMWKPTVVNWIFALAFLASAYVGSRRSIVQRMMEGSVQLPTEIWGRLNLSWVVFFAAMGVLNLVVVYNFDTDTWVNFKLFGLMGLTLAFVVGQGFWLMRHMPDEEEEGPH
jgi:intracellular septation protein